MEQIVFYWVGKELKIPSLLVSSARMVYGKNINIIQLSDYNTGMVSGVDKIIRGENSGHILLDRVKLYCEIETEKKTTIFLDADSLLIQKLKLNEFSKGYHLLKRESGGSSLINHQWPEYYPEFIGKTFEEVMPFLIGVVIICHQKNFFTKLYKEFYKLHKRFHRWYGDQIALKNLFDLEPRKFEIIIDGWAHVVSLNKDGSLDITTLNHTKILTFKGNTKNYIGPVLEKLKKNYDK